ncbi:MAG: tRNA (adenosine(37)-N6)-threonylcarbamoyltransferase complex ATPase subunit type 1 TsaE [Verrucomicrobiota bacterium]
MATFISRNAAETQSLGEEWGRAAQAGWIIGLSGDLGAGKTELIKGLAKGLGITDRIHSPTFALVNEYSGGRLPLFHLDLYRLESREQIVGAGLDQYFLRGDGVAVVEWMERWGVSDFRTSRRPTANFFRDVRIEVLNENERRIIYEDFGG